MMATKAKLTKVDATKSTKAKAKTISKEKKTLESEIALLEEKKVLAEMERKQLDLKIEILKLKNPFHFHIRFNKFIVIFCIIAVIIYTVTAVMLQRTIGYELSPTLTTSVFAFFGTELLGLAGIKIFDTKFSNGNYTGSYTADNGISTMDEKFEVDLGSDNDNDDGDNSDSGGFGGVGGVHFDVGLATGSESDSTDTVDSTDGISTEMDPNAVG